MFTPFFDQLKVGLIWKAQTPFAPRLTIGGSASSGKTLIFSD
jgi:hypothetical protein